MGNSDENLVFIGCYTTPSGDFVGDTRAGSKGIYSIRFNSKTGKIGEDSKLAFEIKNPSWLCLDPSHRNLYAVSELYPENGTVTALNIDRSAGTLTPLPGESVDCGGPETCHCEVDASGAWLTVANYNNGSACVVSLREDGGLGRRTCVVAHQALKRGPNEERQNGPHAHGTFFLPSLPGTSQCVAVPDLGTDTIVVYQLETAMGALTLPSSVGKGYAGPEVEGTPMGSVRVCDGAGPRHVAVHPAGKIVVIVNELDNTVVPCKWDASSASLAICGNSVSTLPPPSSRESLWGGGGCAEVQFHPSGSFLYVSNRFGEQGGEQGSIAVFSVVLGDDGGAELLLRQNYRVGPIPRHFCVDPSGQWLLVCMQGGAGGMCSVRIDPDTGLLSQSGFPAVETIAAPVCAVFV